MSIETVLIPAHTIKGDIKKEPDCVGIWFFSCGENDYKFEPMAIIKEHDELIVCCEYIGATNLEIYNNGLTEPKWIKG